MSIKEWIFGIAVKKGVSKAVTSAIASAVVFLPVLAKHGVTVEIDEAVLATALTALAYGGYEFVRNFAKSKGVKLP